MDKANDYLIHNNEEKLNDNMIGLVSYKTSGWSKKNVKTLYQWIIISCFNINSLERTISLYRDIVRKGTIFGLLVSTLSGTISATQINQNSDANVKFVLNILFSLLSFSITIITGYIKVYRIQEQLEEFIRIKQEWIAFSTTIISEIQLPLDMRQSAFDIIKNNKTKYLELLKTDIDIPENIIKEVQLYMKDYIGSTTHKIKNSLTDMLLAVGNNEHKLYEKIKNNKNNHNITEFEDDEENRINDEEEINHDELEVVIAANTCGDCKIQ
jgi:hypothetical protein